MNRIGVVWKIFPFVGLNIDISVMSRVIAAHVSDVSYRSRPLDKLFVSSYKLHNLFGRHSLNGIAESILNSCPMNRKVQPSYADINASSHNAKIWSYVFIDISGPSMHKISIVRNRNLSIASLFIVSVGSANRTHHSSLIS